MSPTAAQLTAAVAAVLNAVVASKFQADGFLGMIQKVGYARWGLEGYVIAEANRLTGKKPARACGYMACKNLPINQSTSTTCAVMVQTGKLTDDLLLALHDGAYD